MHLGDVPKRDRYPLGAGATRMRAGTGDNSADDREQREGTQLQPRQKDEISPDDGLCTGRMAAGQVVEHDRVGEDDNRQHEVESDEIGIELEEHDESAEHDLSCDPSGQPRCEQCEVAASRGS